MVRKLILLTTLMLFLLSNIGLAQSAAVDMTMLDKINAVEAVVYGAPQTGSLLERVGKLEKDLYGIETHDALIVRLNRLYAYTKDNSSGEPSLVTKLNAIEWTLTHAVSTQAAKARIEGLEQTLLGTAVAGSFDQRVDKLLRIAFADGHLTTANTAIPKDTLIKIKMLTPLDSKKSRKGDVISYQVAEDVYVDGTLVIAKGALGSGKVTKVEPAKNFGRDAKLEASFDTIEAIDGTILETIMGDKAKEETKSLAKAAGATVAGLAILGPVGVVGGAFVQGQQIVIPAGAELYIQTKEDSTIYGIKVK